MYQLTRKWSDVGDFFLTNHSLYLCSYHGDPLLRVLDTEFVEIHRIEGYFSSPVVREDVIYFLDMVRFRTGQLSETTMKAHYDDENCAMNLSPKTVSPLAHMYVGNLKGQGLGMYDLATFELKQLFFNEVKDLYTVVFDKGFLIYGFRSSVLSAHSFANEEFWKRDFKDIGAHKDIFGQQQWGDISLVHVFNDTVIISAGQALTCLRLNDGAVIWQLTGQYSYALCTAMDENLCLGNGLGYRIIDPVTGAWKTDNIRLRDLAFHLTEGGIWPAGVGYTYHNGLLWHDVSSEGICYVVAAEPYSGEYAWLERIPVTGSLTQAPVFSGSKMFVLADSRELFVYEKTA